MVYKKIANKNGDYKAGNNRRFDVLEANEAHTPDGLNVGWDEYADLKTALEAYGLVYDPIDIQLGA